MPGAVTCRIISKEGHVANQDAQDVMREVLTKVRGADWETEKDRLRTELAEYLTHDLFAGDYEFVNVPVNVQLTETVSMGDDVVEITIRGFSLPDKATLAALSHAAW